MSNLDSAKQAVAEELAKAKEGAAFYAQRVAVLEEMIGSLSALHVAEVGSGTPKKRGRKPGSSAKQSSNAKRGRPAKASIAMTNEASGKTQRSGGSKDLPSTKGTFWRDQVTKSPQSWVEILDRAIVNLEISPTAEQRKRLQQRMIFAINALTKDGTIKDSGSGRERRFFQ